MYTPSYLLYSQAPTDWHDEPFEYCFTFQKDFGAPISTATQADMLNQPLQFDPDADFYLRGMAVQEDNPPAGEGRIDFNMRLRDPFGRPLDDGYIPIQAYATLTQNSGVNTPTKGTPTETVWFPELYCPKSCFMFADFQTQVVASKSAQFYCFHLYFKGVKRFKNEDCVPTV
jgi:hypothetical protein